MNILIGILKKCRNFKGFLDEELIEEVLYLVSKKTSYYFPKVLVEGTKIADYMESIEPYSRKIIIRLDGYVHFFHLHQNELCYKIREDSKEISTSISLKYSLLIYLIVNMIKLDETITQRISNKKNDETKKLKNEKVVELKHEKIFINKEKNFLRKHIIKTNKKIGNKVCSINIMNEREDENDDIYLNLISIYNKGKKIDIKCNTVLPVDSNFFDNIENKYSFSDVYDALKKYKICRVDNKSLVEIKVKKNDGKNNYCRIQLNEKNVKIAICNIIGEVIGSPESEYTFEQCILMRYNLLTDYKESV